MGNRPEFIGVRLTYRERRQLEGAAAAAGLSISEFTRDAVRAAAAARGLAAAVEDGSDTRDQEAGT